MTTMTVIIMALMFMFAVVGNYVFGKTEPELAIDAYYFEYDCNLGFDTIGCAFFTLFQVLTTSNWHEVMNSVMDAYGSSAAVYFMTYHITINLVMLSITFAVTIEAYMKARERAEVNKDDEGSASSSAIVRLAPPPKSERRMSLISVHGDGSELPSRTASTHDSDKNDDEELHCLRDRNTTLESVQEYADQLELPKGSTLAEIVLWAKSKLGSKNAKETLKRRSTGFINEAADLSKRQRAASLKRHLGLKNKWKQAIHGVQAQEKIEETANRVKMFRVIRRQGSWRREILQSEKDALTSMVRAIHLMSLCVRIGLLCTVPDTFWVCVGRKRRSSAVTRFSQQYSGPPSKENSSTG